MVDRPPPSRLSVVERGGRLVVIDRASGTIPPTAAERMAEHDRRMGHEAVRPTLPQPRAEPARPTPPKDLLRGALARPDQRPAKEAAPKQASKPWSQKAAAKPSPTPPPSPAPIAERPSPGGANARRKKVVTAKWWDEKGPRTIELGPKGQAAMSAGFFKLFAVLLGIGTFLFLVMPMVALVIAFLLLRFGGKLIGPFGAAIVDKAIAERD